MFKIGLIFFTILKFPTFTEAVAGGELAKPGEFPHLVQLSSDGNFFCGGSILEPKVIITAAHCLAMPQIHAKNIVVTAGGLERGSKNGENVQTSEGARYVIHPEFNSSIIENDLALLLLKKSFKFTNFVKPIQLPPSTRGNLSQIYFRGTIAGWGRTGEQPAAFLQKVSLNLNTRESCNLKSELKPERWAVTSSELCAKFSNVTGVCKGDSGSSLICPHPTKNGSSVICGIGSWKMGPCGNPSGMLAVFLDVSKYVEWIQWTI